MRPGIRLLDGAVAVWALAWVAAGFVVYRQVRQLGELGQTVVTAGVGLAETSNGLRELSAGLRDTGHALDTLSAIPLVGRIENRLERTAADVDRVAVRVRQAAREARASGHEAREPAVALAIVLAIAVGLAPTLPAVTLYLLLRPLVAERLRRPG